MLTVYYFIPIKWGDKRPGTWVPLHSQIAHFNLHQEHFTYRESRVLQTRSSYWYLILVTWHDRHFTSEHLFVLILEKHPINKTSSVINTLWLVDLEARVRNSHSKDVCMYLIQLSTTSGIYKDLFST
jgi:hypothetical protein